MSPRTQSFISTMGAATLIGIALFAVTHTELLTPNLTPREDKAGNTASVVALTPIQLAQATTATPSKSVPKKEAVSTSTKQKKTASEPKITRSETGNTEVTRIENPYPVPPKTFGLVNEETRSALVNIFCAARGGSLRPVSGSGIIIDPSGVILTNAHVAQYVLLSSDPRVDLSCVIRSGSPARPRWNAEVLYMPPAWVKEHASDITLARPTGTGEHDYALLRITGDFPGTSFPSPTIPFISYDEREAIGFVNDLALVASYPAEFLGGITSQFELFSASSVAPIKELLTFAANSVDLVSIGGVIEAQSGSSGGGVVNAWGKLIAVISTTSEGATTNERSLHALTVAYINRDILAQSGLDLSGILAGDVVTEAHNFNTSLAPQMIQLLVDSIGKHQST